MRTLLVADNQAVTAVGVRTLAVESGLYVAAEKWRTVDFHELSVSLSESPDAVVFLDYTLFDCTADQLLVMKDRFPDACFVLFSDALSSDFIRRMCYNGRNFSVLLKGTD